MNTKFKNTSVKDNKNKQKQTNSKSEFNREN